MILRYTSLTTRSETTDKMQYYYSFKGFAETLVATEIITERKNKIS